MWNLEGEFCILTYCFLKVFACTLFIQPHERAKLQLYSQIYLFVGYGIKQKGFRF